MPVRISELARERREIQLETSGGILHVVYRPNVRTPADEARLAACKGDDIYREILESMKKMIVQWDLTGPVYDPETEDVLVEEDMEIPIEPAILQFLPSSQMTGIFQTIMEDMRPNTTKASSKTSGKLYATGSFS